MADGISITAGSGTVVATDDCGGAGHAQVFKLAIATDGSATLIPADATDGLRVNAETVAALIGALTSPASGSVNAQLASIALAVAHGTFAYAAGTSAGTVDVPSGARVRRVSVVSGAGTATVTIAGGATITIPQGTAFDEQIVGDVTTGGDVVIGGTVAAYYVSWTT